LNLEGEKAQISKILENCFDNLRSFTKSYDWYLKLYQRYLTFDV
jgi:hypothetical protein